MKLGPAVQLANRRGYFNRVRGIGFQSTAGWTSSGEPMSDRQDVRCHERARAPTCGRSTSRANAIAWRAPINSLSLATLITSGKDQARAFRRLAFSFGPYRAATNLNKLELTTRSYICIKRK